MNAIDTNIIVRFLTGDHPSQSAKVRTLIASERVFVATTVLLEVEWVLRSTYRYPAAAIFDRLTAFVGLPNVTPEHPGRIAAALDGMARGLDFADALHLAAAGDCDAFLTFDQGLVSKALRLDGLPVKTP